MSLILGYIPRAAETLDAEGLTRKKGKAESTKERRTGRIGRKHESLRMKMDTAGQGY